MALLILSVLAGGILEAINRITWERWILSRCRPDVDVLTVLDGGNLGLYERAVQSSYKYVTFYAHFALAVFCLLVSWIIENPGKSWNSYLPVLVGLAVLICILLRDSYVQWTYFVNYQNKVFKPKGAMNVTK